MTSKNNKLDITSPSDSEPTANLSSRRRLLKNAGMVAPVVLSVTSRPVWAAGCSISGDMSGNLSNPDQNACAAVATAKSPGYWGKWYNVYETLKELGCVKWEVIEGDKKDKKYKDAYNLFDKYKNGEGTDINVLYNWAVAEVAASPYTDLKPCSLGTITSAGSLINDNNDQDGRHLVAALLSAAHPGIAFPYPGSEWTVSYILDKSMSADVEIRDTLFDLTRNFTSTHIEPSSMKRISDDPMIGSAEDAYYWAIEYLGFTDPKFAC